jgi:hypothetical protein
MTHTIDAMEKDGSRFQKWLLKCKADYLAPAFLTAGFLRKSFKPERVMRVFHKRLLAFSMLTVPITFEASEEVNRRHGSYLTLGCGLMMAGMETA